jgi:hypothetical protein
MPVFKQERPAVPQRDELVDELAAELRGGANAAGAPVIFEDEIPQTQTVHVLVLWERWRDVPNGSRGAIIYDAYERVDHAKMLRIKFALGLTFEEAIRGGYLPYKVEPMIRSSDAVDREKVKEEMRRLGARETPRGLELRFPYQSMAENALKHLQQVFGEQYFSLSREVGSVDNWVQV